MDNKYTDIILNVKSTQKIRGEEPYIIDFMTEGKMYREDRKLYLSYKESEIMGMNNQVTTLEVADGEVAMKRSGPSIDTKMLFKNGYRDTGVYSTEYADFKMELLTNSVKCNIENDRGTINIRYGISIKDLTETENHLEISFNDINE